MGVLGPILLYELFIKTNPVASFWFGREAELPQAREEAIPADVMNPEEDKQPVVNQ